MNVILMKLLGGKIIRPKETGEQGICIEFNIDGKDPEEIKTIKEFFENEIKNDGWNEIIYSRPLTPARSQTFRIVGMRIEDRHEKGLQALKQAFEEASQVRGELLLSFDELRLKRHLNREAEILKGGCFVYTGKEIRTESEEEKYIYEELEKKVQEASKRYHAIKDAFSEINGAVLIATTYWFVRCPYCGYEQGAYYKKPSGEIECEACQKKAPIALEVKKIKCCLDAY